MSIDVFSAFLQASGLVQMVMLLLLGLSITSWALMMKKRNQLKQFERVYQHYSAATQHSAQYGDFYQAMQREVKSGLGQVFVIGYEAGVQSVQADRHGAWAKQCMAVETAAMVLQLDAQLNWLATIGATAPFIGLLGTVWGIMSAFSALSLQQSASIAAIAPGLSEALVTTAIGLLVAIPATMAYNRFLARSQYYQEQLELLQSRWAIGFAALLAGDDGSADVS
jgi:biopolymer transport protein TolQ